MGGWDATGGVVEAGWDATGARIEAGWDTGGAGAEAGSKTTFAVETAGADASEEAGVLPMRRGERGEVGDGGDTMIVGRCGEDGSSDEGGVFE